jgi:hypothetical protein
VLLFIIISGAYLVSRPKMGGVARQSFEKSWGTQEKTNPTIEILRNSPTPDPKSYFFA